MKTPLVRDLYVFTGERCEIESVVTADSGTNGSARLSVCLYGEGMTDLWFISPEIDGVQAWSRTTATNHHPSLSAVAVPIGYDRMDIYGEDSDCTRGAWKWQGVSLGRAAWIPAAEMAATSA